VGGTIPNDDIAELKRIGVAEVFTPGAPVEGIVRFLEGLGEPARAAAGERAGGE
jgi:methylmalonyl-CoA mutase C-terminal domain/subunit